MSSGVIVTFLKLSFVVTKNFLCKNVKRKSRVEYTNKPDMSILYMVAHQKQFRKIYDFICTDENNNLEAYTSVFRETYTLISSL